MKHTYNRADAREYLRAMLLRNAAAKDPTDKRNGDPRLKALQAWQQQRLAADYADMRSTPRFKEACDFFINDLYGPQDFSKRDRDVERIYPIMVRLLPAGVLQTVARAVELNALSHELDVAVLAQLPREVTTITRADYARAYAHGTDRHIRRYQLALIIALGRELSRITKLSMVYDLLLLCRWPARLAGLGELQDFLERGFAAFRRLAGVREFLQAIATRERHFMDEMHQVGHRQP